MLQFLTHIGSNSFVQSSRGVCVTKITGSSSDDWIYWHFGYTLSLNYNYYSALTDLHTFQFTVTHALGFSVFIIRLVVTELKQSHRD
jgi:hypothetical protein